MAPRTRSRWERSQRFNQRRGCEVIGKNQKTAKDKVEDGTDKTTQSPPELFTYRDLEISITELGVYFHNQQHGIVMTANIIPPRFLAPESKTHPGSSIGNINEMIAHV